MTKNQYRKLRDALVRAYQNEKTPVEGNFLAVKLLPDLAAIFMEEDELFNDTVFFTSIFDRVKKKGNL